MQSLCAVHKLMGNELSTTKTLQVSGITREDNHQASTVVVTHDRRTMVDWECLRPRAPFSLRHSIQLNIFHENLVKRAVPLYGTTSAKQSFGSKCFLTLVCSSLQTGLGKTPVQRLLRSSNVRVQNEARRSLIRRCWLIINSPNYSVRGLWTKIRLARAPVADDV
jgi:hypothetical protein